MSLLRILFVVTLIGVGLCSAETSTKDGTPTTPETPLTTIANDLEENTTVAETEAYMVAHNEVIENGTLALAVEMVHNLASQPQDDSTLSILVAIYAALLSLDETALVYDAELSLQMLQDTASVIEKVSLSSVNNNDVDWLVRVMTINEIFEYDPNFLKQFNGDVIYVSGILEIRAMCLVNQFNHVGLVLYPSNRSPFRPLPRVDFQITNFTVFDIIVINYHEDVNRLYNNSCFQTFEMVNLHWASDLYAIGLRFGCAQWNNVISEWSSKRCSLVPEAFNTGFRCYCDIKENGKTTEIIIFEYIEDIATSFLYTPFEGGLENSSDLQHMQEIVESINILALTPTNTTSFESFMYYLAQVFSFDSSLIHGSRNSSLLKNIGSILLKVSPDDSSNLIGRGTDIVSSFAITARTYMYDLPMVFVFYANHSNWMTYYRSRDTIDGQKIFTTDVEYAVIFTKSVVRQNARYGLLLYPPDKFFAMATLIDGQKVLASRVLDIVLTPYANTQGDHEQLVHMFFNPQLNKSAVTGCAYWSEPLGDWTVRGCAVNTAIFVDLCTCNMSAGFNESRTRAQFISFKYRNVDFDNNDGGADDHEHPDLETFAVSVLGINQLQHYFGDTVSKEIKLLINILFNPYGTIQLNAGLDNQIIHDARAIFFLNNCTTKQLGVLGQSVGTACVNMTYLEPERRSVALSYNKIMTSYYTNTYTKDEYNVTDFFSSRVSYAVHVSNSVQTQNAQYSFLVYPTNTFLKPLPDIGYVILSSRVVDIVLVPGNATEVEEQFIEIYLDQTVYNSTQGCAFWSNEINDWTSQGCHLFKVNALDVCNCSVSANFLQSRTGGQYIVFTYNPVFFDDDVYLRFGSLSLSDGMVVFSQGVELIHNASRLLVDDSRLTKVLQTYVRVLSIDESILSERQQEVATMIHDITIMMRRYRMKLTSSPIRSYGIQGSWSVKNADVAKDLFSNAVLSSNVTSDISMTSDMSLVSMGFLKLISQFSTPPTGLYLAHGVDGQSKSELLQIAYLLSTFEVLAKNPLFACIIVGNDTIDVHRLVFTVYPMNISPYPRTMTTFPIFNTRQVDVYMDVAGIDSTAQFTLAPTEALLDVVFQPSENPKSYIEVSCASWDDQKLAWTNDICVRNQIDVTINDKISTHVYCRCNLTNRSETRIIMYEYTVMSNFSFVTEIDAQLIVFLIVVALSILGYFFIVLTSIIFPEWIKELGNKILMHLTVSSTLYLTLTTFRETHVIYSDSNHNSVPLIAFTVFVHYTRLTHFIWGLVMSILQYKRFSSAVGTKTISHLLLKVSLAAWVGPAVPLVIFLLWDRETHFCSPNKLTHLVLYLVPGIVITALNIGLMIAIIYTITNKCGKGEDPELKRHNVEKADVLKRQLMTITLMFFLFGFPTAFEMFNDIGSHNTTVEFISKILDPVQGFVLFLFFIVFDPKVRGKWLKKLGYEGHVAPIGGNVGRTGARRANTTGARRTTIRRPPPPTSRRMSSRRVLPPSSS